MKLKSIYLVSMALLAGVFAACNDNDVEKFSIIRCISTARR